jgi:hypothetical protein
VRDIPLQELDYVVYLDESENERLGFDRNINQYLLKRKLEELNVAHHSYGMHCPVYQRIDANPATAGIGLYLVELLLESEATEIYLTGFSFYCGYGYMPYYPLDSMLYRVDELKKNWDKVESFHSAKWLADVCKNNSRIKIDEVLELVFSHKSF